MDQAKIGKFIAENRTAKDITQEELATKIGVTDKAISKWENGRCLPDVSLFKPLCKELDISINELLNGEKDKKERNEDGYINYVKDNNQKHKKKNIIITIVSLIIIVILILGIYFINNFGKTIIYTLSGESKNFRYEGGTLFVTNDKYIFTSGGIHCTKEEICEKEILEMAIIANNKVIRKATKIQGLAILEEEKGYNEIFNDDAIKNKNQWYVSIKYIDNGKMITEKIKLAFQEKYKSNKFFSNKSIPIAKDNIEENKQIDIYSGEDFEEINHERKRLLKEGFKETERYVCLTKEIKNGSTKIELNIDLAAKSIYYEKKNDTTRIISRFGYGTGLGKEISFDVQHYINKEFYWYTYSPKEDKLICTTEDCPGSAWQEAHDFYTLVLKYIK